MVDKWQGAGELGQKRERLKVFKFPVILVQTIPGCKVQHSEYSQDGGNNYTCCQMGTGLIR